MKAPENPHQEILTGFPDTTVTIDQAKLHLMQESLLLVKRGDYRIVTQFEIQGHSHAR
jgi:hypothetical protein